MGRKNDINIADSNTGLKLKKTTGVLDPYIKFIDLFAGIGGFHTAMHSIGAECVFASEIDRFARQTYQANYQKWEPELFSGGSTFNADITSPELDYKNIPDFDVLCAGFPCQAFSHAGLKKGFADTRGTLFFNIEEIVRTKIEQHKKDKSIKIPKVLFLENVKGLKGHDKGITFNTIKQHLYDMGYEVEAEVLNSKNFGVPQNRQRIFIVAWNKKELVSKTFKFPFGINHDGQPIYDSAEVDKLAKKVTVGDILLDDKTLKELEEKEGITYTISQALWDGHQRRRVQHKLKGNGFGYSLFNKNSPYTSTISARYYKDGSEILIDQGPGKRPRKLHPLEAAMLQGYLTKADLNKKDRFIIPVSNAQSYKQFGNSVSVPVIKAIAREIKQQLLS